MSALTLRLANLTASTLASSWRGPDSIEPTSPLEEKTMTVEMNPCSLALKESARDVLRQSCWGGSLFWS